MRVRALVHMPNLEVTPAVRAILLHDHLGDAPGGAEARETGGSQRLVRTKSIHKLLHQKATL